MLLSAVKLSIQRRMAQSYSLPSEDGALAEFLNSALLYVASQAEPNVLLCSHLDGERNDVFRELPNNMYLCFPEYPDFSVQDRHLHMDEGALCQATIEATCFILSGDAKFDVVCTRWISIHVRNQINSFFCEEIKDD